VNDPFKDQDSIQKLHQFYNAGGPYPQKVGKRFQGGLFNRNKHPKAGVKGGSEGTE